jgi:tRNA modification GTPase
LLIQSKSDLAPPDSRFEIAVSALTGVGMDALVDRIIARARNLLPVEGEVALHRRHRDLLAQAVGFLQEVDQSSDPLVIAELLRGARNVLDRLTGQAGVEDVLDSLFARFCIGK